MKTQPQRGAEARRWERWRQDTERRSRTGLTWARKKRRQWSTVIYFEAQRKPRALVGRCPRCHDVIIRIRHKATGKQIDGAVAMHRLAAHRRAKHPEAE